MAKTKLGKKAKKPSDKLAHVDDRELIDFARECYDEYGTAVLEDRSVPDYRDGLIPVARRLMISMYELGVRSNAKFVKSARVVGDTLGRYHPHGDQSGYDALVSMTNTNAILQLVEGDGNWGSMSVRSPAAMRYTECRLHKFADKVLFDKFYLPVVQYGPNYDSSGKEPIVLPALLPIMLLNGKFGIAPGARTNIPACKLSSVVKVLKAAYGGQTVDHKFLYKTLKFVSLYGGQERQDKLVKAERLGIFKGRVGRTTLWSSFTEDQKARTIEIHRFATSWEMPNLLDKILALPGVAGATDDSVVGDKYDKVVVKTKKLEPKEWTTLVEKLDSLLSSRESYSLNFTERFIKPDGSIGSKVKPLSLVDMINQWVEWRTELEKKACVYWIGESDKEIARIKLLILAVLNRKLIIESLDKECSQQELEQWLAKKLKISEVDARTIYDLKVRQLRKLEEKTLKTELKEVMAKKAELEKRKSKPLPYMLKQLDGLIKDVA